MNKEQKRGLESKIATATGLLVGAGVTALLCYKPEFAPFLGSGATGGAVAGAVAGALIGGQTAEIKTLADNPFLNPHLTETAEFRGTVSGAVKGAITGATLGAASGTLIAESACSLSDGALPGFYVGLVAGAATGFIKMPCSKFARKFISYAALSSTLTFGGVYATTQTTPFTETPIVTIEDIDTRIELQRKGIAGQPYWTEQKKKN